MSLTSAANNSAPGFAEQPDYQVFLEPCAKRLRVLFNGETVADTTGVMLMRETGLLPVYYFPLADIRQDLLERSDHSSHCPFKGTASYWSLVVEGRRAENALWGYEQPYDEVAELAGYRAFYWKRVDKWLEEDEEVFVHARDPRVRLDILDSKRRVTVKLGGQIVADSHRARFLFETDLPVRYYIPEADVRFDLLAPSATRSACPYKGRARYWSARIGEQHFEDVAWAYPDPLPESARIKDHVCFYNEHVEAILVDGVEQPRPKTKWS